MSEIDCNDIFEIDCDDDMLEIEYEYLDSLNKEEMLEEIRRENSRIWDYFNEAIDFIENKYYLMDFFDINELLVYCKSCGSSHHSIEYLTYKMDQLD